MLFWLLFSRPALPMLSDDDRAAMVEILRDGLLEHVGSDWLHYWLGMIDLEADGPREAVPILARLYSLLKAGRAAKPRSDSASRDRFIRSCMLYLFRASEVDSLNAIRLRLLPRPKRK